MKEYSSLAQALANVYEENTDAVKKVPVSGGDINRAYVLTLAGGESLFMKENSRANGDFFRAEAEGLAAMKKTGAVRVPDVLASGTSGDRSFLLLSHIPTGRARAGSMEELGHALAAMHAADASRFLPGGTDPIGRYGFAHDNYIGSGFQLNTPKDRWVIFFRECRLRPQFARAGGYFDTADKRRIERLLDHLDQYLAEPAQPSLLHGDLWAGNYMIDREGHPWLIDPAAYVGHAEADIAMTELFGGFDYAFYGAYKEAAGLAADYADRRDLYNLYHLLNHLNLFGGGYLPSVKAILRRYAG